MKKFIAISMVFVLITAMFTMLTSCTGGETKNPAVADIVKAITEKYPMDEDMTQVTSENLMQIHTDLKATNTATLLFTLNPQVLRWTKSPL